MMKIFSVLRSHWKWTALGGVALAATAAIVAGIAGSARSSREESRPLFEVQRGPLIISVGVTGTIKALDQEIIKNEVEGQTTILYIIPEGQRVEKGDLLFDLDASRLQDSLVDQEIATQNAEADFINARETFEVVKNQAQSDIDKAELAYRFAKEDRQKFIDGDYPLQTKDAESKVTLARGDMKRAEERVEGSRKLASQNFITPTELEADEQAALKAKLDMEMAEGKLKLLSDFEYKRTLAQLESDENQARMALDRVKRKASADVVQAEANLKAKESSSQREKGKLDKLKGQLEKTKVYAPREGLVVYATTARGNWHGNEEPLAEGQSVRERQELIYLPTTDAYKADVKVHESSLSKVQAGLPVTLAVNALPERTFEGKVQVISPLPDAQSMWMNPDLKVYNTEIRVSGDTEGLRTGMSCRGEILVQEFDDATYIPVQSVVRESGEPTVYVAHGPEVERRKVALGLDNNRMVQITQGLDPGEWVLLAPPLAADEIQALMETPRRNGGSNAASGDPGAAPREAPSQETAAESPAPPQSPEPAPADAGQNDKAGPSRGPSPEERERRRKEREERMQNMTPEQREQMRQRRQPSQDGASEENQRRPE